ncbi:hypothetical protein KA977_14895 [Candidatus Dependentiae bacterium]|nr:hypothetical protein [Candidatus Dependentiae bacterium]
MKTKLLTVFILISFLFSSCGSKKAFFAPYVQEPKNIIAAVKKTDGKDKYEEYKKILKLYEYEWKLYSDMRDNLSSKKYDEFDVNAEKFIKFHNENRIKLNYDEYYNGMIYYWAKSFVYRYQFDKSIEKLNNVPENSVFYNKSLELVKNLMTDSDDDGYIDEWEVIEGYNPINPFSHP